MALAVATPGCGRGVAAPQSDTEAATALIDRSLRQWKEGRTVAELRGETPPIYVSDELWLNGAKLVDFSIDQEGELFGTNVRFHVTVSVADPKGKESKQAVKYLVTTTPAMTIAREDR
jgi:hypothetical protein